MADRKAVRSSSRRNTPTPQPPSRGTTPTATRTSARNTRATRSQSHDTESAPAAPAASAKITRRGTRQSSVESIESTESRASRSTWVQKKKNPSAAPVGDLTTVEENEDAEDAEEIVDPIPEQQRPETPPSHLANAPLPHRSPALSQMSGTTAFSTASQAEAKDLEPERMLDDLEDLYNAAESFLKLMAPKDARSRDFEKILKDMRIPGSTTTKNFSRKSQVFDTVVEGFRANFDYILPRAVNQSLFGEQEDLESIPGRPDAVMYKANLAVFAKRILTNRGLTAMWTEVEQLDLSFPERFLSRFSDKVSPNGDTSTLLQETFKMALDIRTQLAILNILTEVEGGEDFEPDDILKKVFTDNSDEQATDQDDDDPSPFIRGWNVEGLGAQLAELPQPFNDAVVRRMFDIRAYIDQATNTPDMDALRAKYSWDSFCLRTLRWVRDRNQEIEGSMSGIGALKSQVERSARSLNPALAMKDDEATRTSRMSNVSNISAQSKKSRRSSFTPKKAVQFADAYHFIGGPRKSASKIGATVPEKTAATRAAEITGANQDTDIDHWQPAPVGEDDEEMEDPQEESSTSRFPPATNERIARLEQNKRIEKENQKQRFIDPQNNAERVAWNDDIEDTQGSPRSAGKGKGRASLRGSTTSPARPSTLSSQKRSHAEAIDEVSSDDEGFEQDTRAIDVSKRRKADPGPISSRAHFEGPVELPPSHQSSQRRFPENRSRNVPIRSVPPESDDEYEDDKEAPPPTSSYQKVQAQAKSMSAGFQVRQKARRPRNPWTLEAEEQLTAYIEEYGCQWMHIKRLDTADTQLFLDRTDVDLKDKARNMKVNYMRANTSLPENFDGIPVNKSVLRKYGLID